MPTASEMVSERKSLMGLEDETGVYTYVNDTNYKILQALLSNKGSYKCIAKYNIDVYKDATLNNASGTHLCTLTPGTIFTLTNVSRKLKISGNSSVIDIDNFNCCGSIKLYPDENKEIISREITGYINIFIGDISPGTKENIDKADMKIYVAQTQYDDLLKLKSSGLSTLTDKYNLKSLNYPNKKLNTDSIKQTQNLTERSQELDKLDEKYPIKQETITPKVDAYYPTKPTRWYKENGKDYYTNSRIEDFRSVLDTIDISKLRGIFGLPYQFLPTTDCRIDNSETESVFGITYTEMIANRLPILYMTPGEPVFLSDANDGKDRKNYMTDFISGLYGKDEDNLNNLLNDYAGKLYSIEPKYSTYFKYVNPMCRIGAFYLGLDRNSNDSEEDAKYKQLDGVDIVNYNWAWNDNGEYEGDYNGNEDGGTANTGFAKITGAMNDLAKYMYYQAAVPFYINSETSVQETMTNETTESSLASMVNGLSDKARELQYLMGVGSSVIIQNFDTIAGTVSNIRTAADNLISNLGSGNIFSNLLKNVKTVVSGGRIIFPQIWSNSNFAKSYSVNIRLTTPDFDKKSWYLNIYVPLCHLIAFVLPRGEYQNGYNSPFIVKAFYKGMFNIDMGIITDMNITKGKDGGWTKDDLPTVVEVQFTITDLYSALSLTPTGKLFHANVMQNIAEMDYLANLCGININEPDVARMIEMYLTLNISNVFTDIPTNLTTGLLNKLSNKVDKIFNFL